MPDDSKPPPGSRHFAEHLSGSRASDRQPQDSDSDSEQRITEIRKAIAEGTYDSDEILATALARMLDRIEHED